MAMTEPTAEHLKAAQEWLEKRGGSLEGPLASQSYGWVEVSDENVASLAALLASRDQALVAQRDEAEQMVAELVGREQALREKLAISEGEARVLIGCPCKCHEFGPDPHGDCRECVRGSAVYGYWYTPQQIDNDHEWALWNEKWKAALDLMAGQAERAEAAEARLKRVMEVLEPALKKARGVSSIYQHRSDLAAALAAAQSSEEGA